MTTSKRLQGKLALVSGVTSGIGAATVRALLRQEMHVIGIGRDEARLAAAAADFGSSFRPLLADLAKPADRQRALSELGDEPLQLLVNTAAE
jgi:short-subunit dehydrogenase